MPPTISITGLGKAGLPLSCVIADAGYQILGIDIDEQRCTQINNKENPIPEEPGLKERIEKYGGKKIIASTQAVESAQKAQIHIIIVPIFIDEDKNTVFTHADTAFTNIAKGLKKGDIVVLETTVPPGTTETRFKDILENISGLKAGEDFSLAYSPERIMTGFSISRFTEFPKIIGGYTKECGKKAFDFYKTFASKASLVSNMRTAEMIKVAEGMYRDVNIALANELKKACDASNIDFDELRDNANHDFCNIHKAGLGVGGHCIPVYPWFFIKEMEKKNMKSPLTETAREINDSMIDFWKNKIIDEIKTLNKPREEVSIGVLGINYRSGVKETAYSRAIPFIHLLQKSGLQIFVHDASHTQKEIEALGFQFLENFDTVDVIVLLNKEDYPHMLNSNDYEKVITI